MITRSALLITGSGGLQEEAVTLGVPSLVARDKTERTLGMSEQLNSRLIGANGERLYDSAIEYLEKGRCVIL
jgi:UDP-N-acetylglucosamine 2-epimerase (non-hydrolysing)